MVDESFKAKIESYNSEIENGIFNMVIALCHQYAAKDGMVEAKKKTVALLESIIDGLEM